MQPERRWPALPDPPEQATPGTRDSRRVALVLAILVVVTIGPWLELYNSQHQPRLLMTRAIVEQGTLVLDTYRQELGIDRVEIDGHVYSDKAPGQPTAAIPFYWLADRLGFADDVEVRPSTYDGRDDYPAVYHVGAWWLSLWFAAVPAGILAATMFTRVSARYPHRGLTTALALTGATMILTFGSELYSHVLAAALAYGAWHLLAPLDGRPPRPVWAGLLASLAVSADYATGIIVLVLLLVLAAERRAADLLRFALAGIPVAALLAWYHQVLFGNAVQISYGLKDQDHLVLPPQHLVPVLFGSRGLVFTPVLFLGLWGLSVLIRQGREERREALTAGAVFLGFLLLQASWVNPWGGDGPGPRYMIPAIPFLAVPLAAGWHRRLGPMACAVGFTAMVLPLVTVSLVPEGGALITSHFTNIANFGVAPTIYEIPLGRWPGRLVYLAAVVLVARYALGVFRRHQVEVEPAPP